MLNANLDASLRVDNDYADRASDILDDIAPQGLPAITFAEKSNAVEQAIFAAMSERGADARSSVLGFEGSFHGNSLALTQFSHP